jgi:hypothetical protein
MLISGIRDLQFHIRGIPNLFSEFFTLFFTPITAPFKNPLTGYYYNDIIESKRLSPFRPLLLKFTRTKPYNFMKVCKKGRVKRKITRRLLSKSRVCD